MVSAMMKWAARSASRFGGGEERGPCCGWPLSPAKRDGEPVTLGSMAERVDPARSSNQKTIRALEWSWQNGQLLERLSVWGMLVVGSSQLGQLADSLARLCPHCGQRLPPYISLLCPFSPLPSKLIPVPLISSGLSIRTNCLQNGD